MRLLAIDTALKACSVAVADGAGREVARSALIGTGHGEMLFGMIDAAMADAGVGFHQLDRVGVTVGPGSFTGLRVGIAAARAFALATGCEAVGVTTLAAIAAGAGTERGRPVLASLPAGGGLLYAALHDAAGAELDAPRLADAADLAALALARDAVLAGAGAALIAQALAPGEGIRIVDRRAEPDILAVLALAARAVPQSSPARPLYLRAPDARPPVRADVVP